MCWHAGHTGAGRAMSTADDGDSTESFEFRTFLAPGLGPAYDDLHRAIPAELDAAMRAAGVVGWQIYRNRTTLTHRAVARDRQRMSRILDREPVKLRGRQRVSPYLVAVPPTEV